MRFSVPILRLVADRMAELRQERAAALVSGSAKDHAEYRYGVGFVAGLEAALEIAHVVDKQVDTEAPLERR